MKHSFARIATRFYQCTVTFFLFLTPGIFAKNALAMNYNWSNAKAGATSEYSLYQNYPNPFNPSTTIEFSLKQDGKTSLEVYNILGQKVTTLVNEELKSGTYIYNWNAAAQPSGVYFYRLASGSFVQTKKMLLVK